MKNLWNRAKFVTTGEDGASMIEIIVWFTVVLIVGIGLMLFKDSILAFLGTATGKVGDFNTAIDQIHPN